MKRLKISQIQKQKKNNNKREAPRRRDDYRPVISINKRSISPFVLTISFRVAILFNKKKKKIIKKENI